MKDFSLSHANVLCRAGRLVARLAETPQEVMQAQHLRYVAFNCAQRDANVQQLDSDEYDAQCKHLLVCDTTLPSEACVVGTYRLIHNDVAQRVGRFYTQSDFDLTGLQQFATQQNWQLLEVGRSCVHHDYRIKGVMPLLWRALALYVVQNKIDLLFGCASFNTLDVESVTPALHYLQKNYLCDSSWHVFACSQRRLVLPPMPEHIVPPALPALVKGYLRLGGKIADGAVIDKDFGTIDICMLVPTADIPQRYYNFFTTEST